MSLKYEPSCYPQGGLRGFHFKATCPTEVDFKALSGGISEPFCLNPGLETFKIRFFKKIPLKSGWNRWAHAPIRHVLTVRIWPGWVNALGAADVIFAIKDERRGPFEALCFASDTLLLMQVPVPRQVLQGYLAHKKPPPPTRTLPDDHA